MKYAVNFCTVCDTFLTGRAAKRCSRCLTGCYCSEKCQYEDWSNHKTSCQKIDSWKPPLLKHARHEMNNEMISTPLVFLLATCIRCDNDKDTLPIISPFQSGLYKISLVKKTELCNFLGFDSSRIRNVQWDEGVFRCDTVGWKTSNCVYSYMNIPVYTSDMESTRDVAKIYREISPKIWIVDKMGKLDTGWTLAVSIKYLLYPPPVQ